MTAIQTNPVIGKNLVVIGFLKCKTARAISQPDPARNDRNKRGFIPIFGALDLPCLPLTVLHDNSDHKYHDTHANQNPVIRLYGRLRLK